MNCMGNRTYYEKRTYTVDEIQKILGISRNTTYSLIKQNKFRSIRVGSVIRISKRSFDEWFEENGGKQCHT